VRNSAKTELETELIENSLRALPLEAQQFLELQQKHAYDLIR
jgi:hypothetical protein